VVFIGQIEHCFSEQITCANPSFCDGRPGFKEMLEEIAQHLLNDNHVIVASNEKSIMTRVNSLCCLLQTDLQLYKVHMTRKNVCDGKNIMFSIYSP